LDLLELETSIENNYERGVASVGFLEINNPL
jgi:hypothetical protein